MHGVADHRLGHALVVAGAIRCIVRLLATAQPGFAGFPRGELERREPGAAIAATPVIAPAGDKIDLDRLVEGHHGLHRRSHQATACRPSEACAA